MENFLKAEHILVSPQGDLNGVVDATLEAKKLKRKVRAGLLSFHSVPYVVSRTDFVAAVPSRMACYLVPLFNLQCFALPFKVKGYTLKCVWHERTSSSILHSWFRKKVKKICDELPAVEV
jgi:DNA-binding transcriptional LysR family regulator